MARPLPTARARPLRDPGRAAHPAGPAPDAGGRPGPDQDHQGPGRQIRPGRRGAEGPLERDCRPDPGPPHPAGEALDAARRRRRQPGDPGRGAGGGPGAASGRRDPGPGEPLPGRRLGGPSAHRPGPVAGPPAPGAAPRSRGPRGDRSTPPPNRNWPRAWPDLPDGPLKQPRSPVSAARSCAARRAA